VRGERTHYRAFTVNPCNELEVAGAAEDNGNDPPFSTSAGTASTSASAEPPRRGSGAP